MDTAPITHYSQSGRARRDSTLRGTGLENIIQQVSEASPLELVQLERDGVEGQYLYDLSDRLGMPAGRLFSHLKIPPATANRKKAPGAVVEGRAGIAALGLLRLVGIATDLVGSSTHPDAAHFDAMKWLGQWLEQVQPSLGGHKPSELLDTPAGIDMVARALAAIESGAYQ